MKSPFPVLALVAVSCTVLFACSSAPADTAASPSGATVVGPGGEAVPVPATLPAACRQAFTQIGGPLLSVREGLKAMIVGVSTEDVSAGARRIPAAWSVLEGAGVESALLDCSSASRTAGPAFRAAVEAVGTQHLVAGIIADSGEVPPAGAASLHRTLELVEAALAVKV